MYARPKMYLRLTGPIQPQLDGFRRLLFQSSIAQYVRRHSWFDLSFSKNEVTR